MNRAGIGTARRQPGHPLLFGVEFAGVRYTYRLARGLAATLPGELTGITHVHSTTTLTSAGCDRLAEQVPNLGATTRVLKRVRAATALS
jgi:hypothetical protein